MAEAELIRLRLLAEYERRATKAAEPAQLPLDLGNSLYTDETPEFHGTQVGVSRHAAAGEELCQPCDTFMQEMVAAGFAVRLEETSPCLT